MKSSLLLALLIPLISASQEPAEGIFPVKDSAVYYERVISAADLSSQDIYKVVKSWGVSSFAAIHDPLKADDKDLGLIAYASWLALPFYYPAMLGTTIESENRYSYSLKIYIKDKKLKAVISDIDFNQCAFAGRPQILSLRIETEQILMNSLTGKKKRDRIYDEFRNNFERANDYFNSILASLEKAVTNGNAELNF